MVRLASSALPLLATTTNEDPSAPTMNLIERYIFRRALTLTLITLGATTVVVLITQLLLYVNLLTDSGQAIVTFLHLALMLVPAMIVVVAPFAVLIGASQTLSGMNNDSELAVIEAAGGSPKITAKPVLVLGVTFSMICLSVALFVEPWSNRQMRDIISGAGADLVRYAVQSGSFKKLDDGLYIQIAEQLPGGTFGGIFIADLRESTAELLYYAKRGAIQETGETELLVMVDGEIQRRNASTGEISIIRFASYAIDFSQFGPASKAAVYFPKERSTAFLVNPDPNDTFAKNRPETLRAELNRRLSEWLFSTAFALTAVYFAGAARSNRQERLWSLAAAALVAFAFRGAGFFTMNASGGSPTMALAAYGVPLSAIVLFSWLLLTGRQLRIPQRFVDGAAAAVAALERRRVGLQLWIRGYRRARVEHGS